MNSLFLTAITAVAGSSFWPTKANEWIGLLGGALGGIGFLISVFNYRRDRAKIRVSFSRRPYATRGLAGRFDPAKTYYLVKIRNEGRRAVQILRVDGIFYRGGGFLVWDSGGSVLKEENPETIVPVETSGLKLDEIWYFSVAMGNGPEFRTYLDRIPQRWLRALATWRDRRHLRTEILTKQDALLYPDFQPVPPQAPEKQT